VADIVKDAQELYTDAIDATGEQRRQIEEDLAFSDPSDPQQWEADVKKQRESDPGGKRPCLVMDQVGQYVSNVAGQVEQRPPALHAVPVGGGADRKVAESLDGLFRHIEHTSRAQQHYARVLTSAARAGVGYIVVRPEYTDRALGYQEPRISSEPDPLRVVLDPWSIELDGSDANHGFLLTPYSHREWERQFGEKSPKVNFGDMSGRQSKDERESVIAAEMWKIEDQKKNIIVFLNRKGEEVSLPEDDFHIANQRGEVGRYVRNYHDKYRCVKWARLSGAEVLTKETEYPASGIGIVPVYGYVGWSDGRMRYCGIPRRARHPQQAYNFFMSEIRAYMNQAPKAPWVAPVAAIKGFEKLWDRAANESRATLPFNHKDENGDPIPPPARTPIAINLTNLMAGAEQALKDIQASLGMYYASLGAPSNETSGVAIDSRKEQGEAATAHFPAHLAAGLGQVGKLVMEMVPRLIDTKRQVRILSIDETPGEIVVDPEQQDAVQEQEGAPLSINPNVGKYDVRVVVGSSFSTQRQQAQEAYTEMMRASPEMMPAIAPLWAQTLDVPYADKLAQVLTAVAPPEVKAILQPNDQQTSATLKAENEQLKLALQEATAVASEAQEEITEIHAELASVKADHDAKAQEQARKDREFELKVAQSAVEAEFKGEELELKKADMALKAQSQKDAKEQAAMQAEQAAQEPEPTTDPEQDDQMEEALTGAVEQVVKGQEQTSKALEQTNKAVADLAQGQEQLQKLMKTLITVVQAPRHKKLVFDKNGDPAGSEETVVMPPTIQ